MRVRTGALLCEQQEIDGNTDVEIVSCSRKLPESIVSRMTRSLLIQSLSDTAESFAPLGPNVAGSFFYARFKTAMLEPRPSIYQLVGTEISGLSNSQVPLHYQAQEKLPEGPMIQQKKSSHNAWLDLFR